MEILLYCEVSVLCLILLGIMSFKSSDMGLYTHRKKRAFLTSIYFSIILNVSELLWHIGNSKFFDFPFVSIEIINAVYFISVESAAYSWLMFSDSFDEDEKKSNVLRSTLYHLPLAALVAIFITNHFTGCIFSFDANGNYVRGSLFFLEYVFGFFYLFVSLIINVKNFFSNEKSDKHDIYRTMIAFAIPLVIGMVLQMVFPLLPIVSVSSVVSFMLVYTSSLRIQIALDPLTGINNRRILFKELERKLKNVRINRKLYFMFIDIDSFKKLNDSYGHHEGDVVLRLVADSLRMLCSDISGFCARFGGDEFALIVELDMCEDISFVYNLIKRKINEQVKALGLKHDVSVSIGHAEYLKDAYSIQELINTADEVMYKNKSHN